MSKATVARNTLDRQADLFMAFAFVISLLAAIGWLFNMPILASLRPEYLPMAPGTTLIFLGLWGCLVYPKGISCPALDKVPHPGRCLGMLILVLLLAIRTLTGMASIWNNGYTRTRPCSAKSPPVACPRWLPWFFPGDPGIAIITGREPCQRTKVPPRHRPGGFYPSSFDHPWLSLRDTAFLWRHDHTGGNTTALAFWFLSLALLMMAGPACLAGTSRHGVIS